MTESDQSAATHSYSPPSPRPDDGPIFAAPIKIGRYRVERILGQGGFGIVYLAGDEQLGRQVAVKVPHARHLLCPEDAEAYLLEARTVAKLEHPHIVPVYDVGGTPDFPCYVVSRYIAGEDLAKKIRQTAISYPSAAEIVATIAGALHFAHKRGIVHRDIKPGNILIGNDGLPYVVDFGLALWEENIGKGPQFVGTIAYMSPEQARGEGHRVDGRSDIYSLGVVLYRLLTGRVPFSEGGESELLTLIATQDPKPPRQIDDLIPRELERICLRALCKKASERYTTALDMADDLNHFLARYLGTGEGSTAVMAEVGIAATAGKSSDSSAVESDSRRIRIVPKGLRPFDEHDADFFLELLPGARDRDGLPDSLRFWKTRIEETDADKTFAVGLIYGPSGCGKSSLVKAGLLPKLAPDVWPMYVEATPDETEARLLRGIRKRCSAVGNGDGLTETLAAMRRGTGIPTGKKVLIIIDQFEQWLQATEHLETSELVQALRQCDGGRVQCIVMVRDDFWMAATRFMRELEVRLVEAENSAAVDLFPIRHAEKVLVAYGRAFGALPADGDALNDDQKAFIAESVFGLAEDSKVISVRLAIFAEMMKDKSWTLATLKGLGGTRGVGVKFLDETLSAPTATPEFRYHQAGVRAVLSALLPKSGADIKGEMKSFAKLLEASGYQSRPRDFQELIRILDSEVRLITPTDPEGLQPDDVTAPAAEPGHKYYQLTHDYLVYPLREWLTSKQRETRRGRAQLKLDDRAAAWNAKPETRQLPTLWEYLSIVGLTRHSKWTDSHRQMIVAASRHYGLRGVIACLVMFIVSIGALKFRRDYQATQERLRINGMVDQLLVAQTDDVPRIVAAVERESEFAVARLRQIADNPANPATDRLRATLVLATSPGERATQLMQSAMSADRRTLAVIRDRIQPFAKELRTELWSAMFDEQNQLSSKLRLGGLLAVSDPLGARWQEIAPTIVNALLSEDAIDIDYWTELLRPVGNQLIPALTRRISDTSALTPHHTLLVRILVRYADADLLSKLILAAEPRLFPTLLSGKLRHRDAVIQQLREALESPQNAGEGTNDRLRSQGNALIALIGLGSFDDLQKHLSLSVSPELRTRFVLALRDFGLPPETLLEFWDKVSDPVARQTILLALERYGSLELSTLTDKRLQGLLLQLLQPGSSLAERSAAEWLLHQRGKLQTAHEVQMGIARRVAPTASELRDQQWWVNSQGYIMSIARGPLKFTRGSPADEPEREATEAEVLTTIDHTFAIGTHEVTMEQFRRFQPQMEFATDVASDASCPANRVSLVAAMQYCRWLSEQESIPSDQMCYPPVDTIKVDDVFLPAERLLKTGYRLPTEAEWECACRAGSQTPWFFGRQQADLQHYGWYVFNSDNRLHKVGSRMPNPWGLFDMGGNVAEWCQPMANPSPNEQPYVLRGGYYLLAAGRLRSAQRQPQSINGYSFTGLRIARTIAPEKPADISPSR